MVVHQCVIVFFFKVPPFCDWQASGRRQGGECVDRGGRTTATKAASQ